MALLGRAHVALRLETVSSKRSDPGPMWLCWPNSKAHVARLVALLGQVLWAHEALLGQIQGPYGSGDV